MLHGAMQSAVSQLELAELLAPTHGHLSTGEQGGQSHYAAGADTAAEVATWRRLLEPRSPYVMGVSSGALIALRAALTLSAIDRLVPSSRRCSCTR